MTSATAEVRSFPKGEPAKTIPLALREVESAGYSALYAPGFGQARVKEPNNPGLRRLHQTLTGIYFGRTSGGTGVAIFAHTPHYLATPDNIEAAIDYRLIDGAAATKEVAREIPRLLDLEGQNVFVVDYQKWEKAPSGIIPLSEALAHPVTIPFLGGRERAEKYIDEYHSKVASKHLIKIFKSNDLGEIPVARLAGFGYGLGYNLYADGDLLGNGRFAGRPLEKLVLKK